jgi:hypothetical protein
MVHTVKVANFLQIRLVLLLSVGCRQLQPYQGKHDLPGTWLCRTVGIRTHTQHEVDFAMHNYGFASLSFDNDSSFSFSLEILRDVVLEEEVLGNRYSRTVIQAGYKQYRKGYYCATDSSIILYDANRTRANEESYVFEGRTLLTRSTDEDSRLWEISWAKEN